MAASALSSFCLVVVRGWRRNGKGLKCVNGQFFTRCVSDVNFLFVCLQLSCMWEDVRWLRQSMSVSMSSSSTLQARHKMLTAAGQLQVRKPTDQLQ